MMVVVSLQTNYAWQLRSGAVFGKRKTLSWSKSCKGYVDRNMMNELEWHKRVDSGGHANDDGTCSISKVVLQTSCLRLLEHVQGDLYLSEKYRRSRLLS